jgi:hypothetical protein
MKTLRLLLLAGLAGLALHAQSVFVPANGSYVGQSLSSVNPTGTCLASTQVFNYVTGHTWACVGVPGAMAWTDQATLSGGALPIFTATVNQSTGSAVCNFAPINGSVPACLINDNTGNTGFINPVLPTFINLPAATFSTPVVLNFITNYYGTTGTTWPTTGSPLVWCGGQDALQLCGGPFNYWSAQSPLRNSIGTQANTYFRFSGIYNGTDIFLQGDSGLYQTLNAAHINSNIFAAVGVSSTGGTISILFGGILNLGQNSFIATDTTSKSDTAGLITLAAGTGSYTFVGYQGGNHTGTPYCTASDTTAANPVRVLATNTTLTITGTTTDVIAYICVFASN